MTIWISVWRETGGFGVADGQTTFWSKVKMDRLFCYNKVNLFYELFGSGIEGGSFRTLISNDITSMFAV